MSNWTAEQREEYRVEQLTSPLFDLWLRFEKAFARIAMDRLGVSDADAEAAAKQMGECGADSGSAYAYLLRHIKTERIMRGFYAKWSAVQEAGMGKECMSIDEVHSQFAKLSAGST